MRVDRFYVAEPLAVGRELALADAAAAHVARVLRAAPGDAITLFDGRGGEYGASIVAVRGGKVLVRVATHDPIERESPFALTLIQGVSRGERMDWVIQKATELGVRAVLPVFTERSVVKLDARQSATRLQHWRAVAIAACEQCGRNCVPEIAAAASLAQALANPPAGTRVLLSPLSNATLAATVSANPVTLLVGPEGGLSPQEHEAAARAGFVACQLGPRVLRTETAAIAALAVLQALQGDLGERRGPHDSVVRRGG